MARPKKTPHLPETQERILQAAEKAFAQGGYSRTRLEDIALSVGIRRSSLLHHFASKELLYERVVQRAFDDLAQALSQQAGTGLVDLAQAFESFLEKRHQAARLFLLELLDPSSEGFSRLQARLDPLLEQTHRQLHAAGTPIARHLLFGFLISELARASAGPERAALWGSGPASLSERARHVLLPSQTQPQGAPDATHPTSSKLKK